MTDTATTAITETETTSPSQPTRQRLPQTRQSVTHRFDIDQLKGYITVGLYPDGRPGEVFIKIAKHGSTMSGLVDTIAVLTSLALQYGVTVESLARKFEFTRFEPSGWTQHPDLRQAKSLVDYVFRWLGLEFSDTYRQEQVARQQQEDDADPDVNEVSDQITIDE